MKIDDINTINQKFNELSNEKKKEYADNERHTMNFLGILLNIFYHYFHKKRMKIMKMKLVNVFRKQETHPSHLM